MCIIVSSDDAVSTSPPLLAGILSRFVDISTESLNAHSYVIRIYSVVV